MRSSPFVRRDGPLGELACSYLDALLAADRVAAAGLVHRALESSVAIEDLYLRVFQPTLWEIGRLWELGRVSVAAEHYATASTQIIMSQLELPRGPEAGEECRAIVCSAAGERHELGSRMVSDFLEMGGWCCFYLGGDVPADALAQAVVVYRADLVALSVTLDANVPAAAAAIAALRTDSRTAAVPVLVGGQALGPDPGGRALEADGHAADAQQAVALARRLVAGAAPGS